MIGLWAASLIALSGLDLYIGLYYGVLALRRWRRPGGEDAAALAGRFAAFALFIGVFSFAAALTAEASDPAAALLPQKAQFIGLFAAIGCFVDFGARLADGWRPKVVRATYAWAAIGGAAGVVGLFLEPAVVDSGYDWGPTTPANRPLARLSLAGACWLLAGMAVAARVCSRLVIRRAARIEVRVAALVTGVVVIAGIFDSLSLLFDWVPLRLADHLAAVPVIGFSFALLGHALRVDGALAARRRQLARSYAQLNSAQAALVRQEQLAAIGELSAVIAHEVRNPLAIMKNALSGVGRPKLPEEDRRTLLEILDEEADHLNALIDDLFAYAKPIAPTAQSVDMRGLVMRAVQLAAGGMGDRGLVEVELDLDESLPRVEGDETLLRHALINIADNALKAMPLGGRLTVELSARDVDGRAHVAVDFHDTGEGMDTSVRVRARDPFFTTRQTGTGLGLAIVERVAQAHGGRVEIVSRHGRGTCVSVVVPVVRSSSAPPIDEADRPSSGAP